MNSQRIESIEIPNRLADLLSRFGRAQWVGLIKRSVTRWLILLSLVFLVCVVVERLEAIPAMIRGAILLSIVGVTVYQLLQILSWPLRHRGLLALAKRFAQKQVDTQWADFADRLYGAIELSQSPRELSRSSDLCLASLRRLDDQAAELGDSFLAESSQLVWRRGFSVFLMGCFLCMAAMPAACWNTTQRVLLPWQSIERYTFVAKPSLPTVVHVPIGETSSWSFQLPNGGRWLPAAATLLGEGWSQSAELIASDNPDFAGRYQFEIPAIQQPGEFTVRVGDLVAKQRFSPAPRPLLNSLDAEVCLPDYLRFANQDPCLVTTIDDGLLTVVEGASAHVTATFSNQLSRATVNGHAIEVTGDRLKIPIRGQEQLLVDWTDELGIHAAQPLLITVERVADRSPALQVAHEPIDQRVLDSQSLEFRLQAEDDFRVREVTLHWMSGDQTGQRVIGPAERLPVTSLANDELVQLPLKAIFQASALNAPNGIVQVRFSITDDHPEHQPVFSQPIELHVLSANDHAIWISNQLERWQQSALDLRDQELQLFQRNQTLYSVPSEKRDADWAERVFRQAREETINARQLRQVATEGKRLLQMAARNQRVDVQELETLATSVNALSNMASQQMPEVSKLLKQAADLADASLAAEMAAGDKPAADAGATQAARQPGNKGQGNKDEDSPFQAAADTESTQGDLKSGQGSAAGETKAAAASDDGSDPRLGLLSTNVIDTSGRKVKPTAKSKAEAQQQVDEALAAAIERHTELVAQFDEVADQLKNLLGNLEDSTLVKRLKSVSRMQNRVSVQLSHQMERRFAQPSVGQDADVEPLVQQVAEATRRVGLVMDDLDAFCQRRDVPHFAHVLAEMKASLVTQKLSQLEKDVMDRPGLAFSAAEYWADTLDRWADDLVLPGEEQEPSNSTLKNPKSLSPKIILELMRVLESQVNLRAQTRVAQQGKQAMEPNDYMAEAVRLSEAQDLLRDRIDVVIDTLIAVPEGQLHFRGEIDLLGFASDAMVDATKTLVQPETGPPAIAAQTEAIELLLRSNKVNPDTSSNSRQGSQGGTTDQAALTLLAEGLNEKAMQRDSETLMSTGAQNNRVPQVIQLGLQEYYQRLDQRRASDRALPSNQEPSE